MKINLFARIAAIIILVAVVISTALIIWFEGYVGPEEFIDGEFIPLPTPAVGDFNND